MNNAMNSRNILGSITTVTNEIKIEDIKQYAKVKTEPTHEHYDNLQITHETGKENQYSIRDSIVYEEDIKHVVFDNDETPKKCSEYKGGIENQFSFRDSIIFKEELPISMDDIHSNTLIQFQEVKKELSDVEKISQPLKTPPHAAIEANLEYQHTYRDAIVFKEDPDDLSKDDNFLKEEMDIGPEILQAVVLCDTDKNIAKANYSNNEKDKQNSGKTTLRIKGLDKNAYNKKNVFVCDHCEMRFDTKLRISQHMRIHKRIDQKSEHFRDIIKKHSPKEREQHKCNICNKVFSFYHNLQRHLKIHDGTFRIFKCHKCSKTYRSKEYLQYHITNIHLGSLEAKRNEIKCRYCSKIHTNRANRSRHEKWYCMNNDERLPSGACEKERRKYLERKRKLTCDICQKTYLQKQSLIQHILLHMSKVKPKEKKDKQCDICLQKFTRKTNLKHHIHAKHLNIKNFFCNICKSGFVRKYSLTLHEKTCQALNNRKEKKFACHLCSNKYSSKTGLKLHIESHHLGIKKFSCQYCKGKFTQKWTRDSHEKKCQSSLCTVKSK